MASKKTESKEDFGNMSYLLGILSIVFAFFTPLAGLLLGIIGFMQSKKEKTSLSEKARKLNTVGIVLSIILIVVSLFLVYYFSPQGIGSIQNLP